MKKNEQFEKQLLGRCIKCERFVYSDEYKTIRSMAEFAKQGTCKSCLKNEYDLDFFIRKFESIPESRWVVSKYKEGDKFCALGHCGEIDSNSPTAESIALEDIFQEAKLRVSLVNDGECSLYQQDTPRSRILAALNDLKNKRKD